LFSFGKGAVFLPREGTSDQIVVDETWRENVYRLVPEWVKGGTVVDLGANVGAVSIWAAVHGAAKVVAVEPDPANLTALHANLDENQIPFGQVVVAPWAIHGRDAGGVAGSGSCWATMEGESGGRRVLEWRGGTIRPAGAVEAVPFSVLLDPYPVVDLLKIDIEGGEWGILSEPANVALLSEKVRRMVIEFHNFGWSGVHTFGRVVESLAEVGKIEILGRPSVGGLLWWEAYR
jgi:FkbM family methyltransferase